MGDFVDRLWKDKNGKQALVEKPNIPLIGWFVFMILGRLLPVGSLRNVSEIISFGFIFTWAWLEIYSGKSYARRLLGAVVLIVIILKRA